MADVRWGEQTDEEMMFTALSYPIDDEAAVETTQQTGRSISECMHGAVRSSFGDRKPVPDTESDGYALEVAVPENLIADDGAGRARGGAEDFELLL